MTQVLSRLCEADSAELAENDPVALCGMAKEGRPLTFRQIAILMDVSHETVRQLHNSGLEKLRRLCEEDEEVMEIVRAMLARSEP